MKKISDYVNRVISSLGINETNGFYVYSFLVMMLLTSAIGIVAVVLYLLLGNTKILFPFWILCGWIGFWIGSKSK